MNGDPNFWWREPKGLLQTLRSSRNKVRMSVLRRGGYGWSRDKPTRTPTVQGWGMLHHFIKKENKIDLLCSWRAALARAGAVPECRARSRTNQRTGRLWSSHILVGSRRPLVTRSVSTPVPFPAPSLSPLTTPWGGRASPAHSHEHAVPAPRYLNSWPNPHTHNTLAHKHTRAGLDAPQTARHGMELPPGPPCALHLLAFTYQAKFGPFCLLQGPEWKLLRMFPHVPQILYQSVL